MVEIVWSRIAEDQLRRAVQYIQVEQGTFYANLVLHKIFDSIEHLAEFPKAGPLEPLLQHKKSEYRYVVAWSYKIIYRISSRKIFIVRVFHTSQHPSKIRKGG
jgi:toxin ParE1/3/4